MFLLDGNNIMGQRVGWHRDKPAARRRLISELMRLAERLHVDITVVFDAPAGAPSERFGRLEVCYACNNETADDRMVELARTRPRDSDLTAVTSDRALAGRLSELGVPVIRSGTFRKQYGIS